MTAKRGRPVGPTVDRLRSLDVTETAIGAARLVRNRSRELDRALWADAPKRDDSELPTSHTAREMSRLHRYAMIGLGPDSYGDHDEAAGWAEYIASWLRGTGVEETSAQTVLDAASARLAIARGERVELVPLAALAGCALATLRRAIADGVVRVRRAGSRVSVSADDAQEWLRSRGVS